MKVLKRIALCLCLVFSASILWACGTTDAKVVEIYFKEGSVLTEVPQYSRWSNDDVIVIAKYDDGTEKEVTGVTFEGVSTNTAGPKTLKATYKGVSCTIVVTVTEAEFTRDYSVIGVKSPLFVETLEANKKVNEYVDQIAADAESKTKGFVKTDSMYKVGNDNAFKFSPQLAVLYTNDTEDTIDKDFPIAANVYMHNGSEYVLLSTDLDTYVSIDADNHEFQFTDAALNKKFKIEVRPDFAINYDEEYGGGEIVLDGDKFKSAEPFEFEVVDGFNVYNAKQLSIIDNSNDEGKWDAVKGDFKNVQTNAVILHNDIEITKNDIPSVHFYSDSNTNGYAGNDLEQLKGYMINEDGYYNQAIVYKRVIPDGGKFTFEGNHFKVSALELPLVNNPEWGVDNVAVVCTSLFGFIDNYTDPTNHPAGRDAVNKGQADANEETCIINNVAFMGNSNKNESTGPAGMCCYKTENVNFTMNNCLSQAWYIAHFFEGSSRSGDTVTHTLKDCTAFDSYNTIMYCQGARNVNIENSYLIGAGGPVMICDEEVDEYDLNGDGDETDAGEAFHFPTNVNVKDSVLQSWVAGSEAWFISVNAVQVVATFKTLDLSAANNSIVSKNKDNIDVINLVAVYKDSDAAGIADCNISGTFKDTTVNDNGTPEDTTDDTNKFKTGLVLNSQEEDPIDLAKQDAINKVTAAIVAQNGGNVPANIKELVTEVLSNTALLQDFNGTYAVPSDSGFLVEPDYTYMGTNGKLFQPGYLNIHLFNGMAAVLGLK